MEAYLTRTDLPQFLQSQIRATDEVIRDLLLVHHWAVDLKMDNTYTPCKMYNVTKAVSTGPSYS